MVRRVERSARRTRSWWRILVEAVADNCVQEIAVILMGIVLLLLFVYLRTRS